MTILNRNCSKKQGGAFVFDVLARSLVLVHWRWNRILLENRITKQYCLLMVLATAMITRREVGLLSVGRECSLQFRWLTIVGKCRTRASLHLPDGMFPPNIIT